MRSVERSPIADVSPGNTGTSTWGIPSERATSAACRGPAPPKATSVNWRGSWPFWIVRERIAFAMLWLTSVITPAAASEVPSSSCALSRSMAAVAQLWIDLHLAAEEVLGTEASEDDVRVGDGRFFSPAAVARGSRLGACAPRADPEGAARIDVRDAASAGADRVHVDHRDEDRVAGDERVAGRRLGDPARRDDADVGARSPDVERDQVLLSRAAPGVGTGEDAGRRAAEQERRRKLRGYLAGHDAPVRAHEP